MADGLITYEEATGAPPLAASAPAPAAAVPDAAPMPGDAPPLTVHVGKRAAPAAAPNPGLISYEDAVAATPNASGPLANAPDDGYLSGAAKGIGTAAVKAIGNTAGFVGGLGNLADYLVARGEHAVTGRPVEDILTDMAKQKRDQAASSSVPSWTDPRNVFPAPADVSGPILKQTGEYVPTSEPGKLAQAGTEAVLSSVGPGVGARVGAMGDVMRAAGAMAPANFGAGVAAQGATDLTGDPLAGLAAGVGGAGVVHAGMGLAGSVAKPIIGGIPGIENVPVVGPRVVANRENSAATQVLAKSSDPAALKVWAAQPAPDSPVPNSPQTTAGAVGNDRGLFQAEKDARNVNNAPFNAIDSAQSGAGQAAILSGQPTGDVFRPGQIVRQRLDALDNAADAAEARLNAAHQDATINRANATQSYADQQRGALATRTDARAQDALDEQGRAQAAQQAEHDRLAQSFADTHAQLTQQAQEAAGALGPQVAPEQLGATLRAAQDAREAAVKQHVGALYKAVDPDGTLTTVVTPLKQTVAGIRSDIDPVAGVQPSGTEASLHADIMRAPDVIPFRSLQQFDARATAAMADARRNPNPNDPQALSRLTALKGAIKDNIANAAEAQVAHQTRQVQAGMMRDEDTLQANLRGFWGDEAAGAADASANFARFGTDPVGLAGGGATTGARPIRAVGEAAGQPRQAPRDPRLSEQAPLFDDTEITRRPTTPGVPRPRDLHQFIRDNGGMQDPGGDLKSMGFDRVRGFIAKPGQGLSPDHMREAAAEAGYLGADTDRAMSETTINDLHDAIGSDRAVHSVRDQDAAHAWDAYDDANEEYNRVKGPQSRSAAPPRAPASAYGPQDAYPPGMSPDDLRAANDANGLTPNWDQAASDRLKTANAAHADYRQTFKGGPVGPTTKTNGFAGQYVTPNSALPAAAFRPGDKGLETLNAFLRANGNDPAAVEAIRQQAYNQIRNKLLPIGTVSPTAVAKFRTDYAPAIRALDAVSPGFMNSVDSAVNATQTFLDAGIEHRQQIAAAQREAARQALIDNAARRSQLGEANAADRAQVKSLLDDRTSDDRAQEAASRDAVRAQVGQMQDVTKAARSSPAGQYAKAVGGAIASSEVENAVGGLLKTGKDGAARMRSLVQSVASDPDAVAGLRKAGLDWMVRSFKNANGEMSGAAYIDFIRNNLDTLKELYPSDHVSMMGAVARRIEEDTRWRTMTAVKGGSDSVKNAIAYAKDKGGEVAKHVSIMSAATAGLLAGGVKGASVGASLYLLNSLRSAGIKSAADVYHDALSDPAKARLWISNMPQGNQGGKLNALTGLIRRSLILGPMQTPANQKPTQPSPITIPPDHPLLNQARQAPDGHHYVPDPRGQGRFMRVGP